MAEHNARGFSATTVNTGDGTVTGTATFDTGALEMQGGGGLQNTAVRGDGTIECRSLVIQTDPSQPASSGKNILDYIQENYQGTGASTGSSGDLIVTGNLRGEKTQTVEVLDADFEVMGQGETDIELRYNGTTYDISKGGWAKVFVAGCMNEPFQLSDGAMSEDYILSPDLVDIVTFPMFRLDKSGTGLRFIFTGAECPWVIDQTWDSSAWFRTCTKWCQENVKQATGILFFDKKIHFLDGNRYDRGGASFPVCLVAYGAPAFERIRKIDGMAVLLDHSNVD
jgi:hypothetical protein